MPLVDGNGGRPLRAGDEDTCTDANFDQTLDFERDEGFSNRGTRHAELHREVALGGQALAASELSRGDESRQLVGNLTVQTAVIDSLDRHTKTLTRPRRRCKQKTS